MKKTLIALLALGSISMGATIAEIDTTDSNLKAYWNFDSSNEITSGTGTWKNLPTWNSTGYGEMSSKSTNLYTEDAGLSASAGFTISFDINNASNGTLLTVGTQKGLDQAWRSCSITLSSGVSEGTSLISAQFLGNTANAIKQELTLSTEDWTTLTLVASGGTSKTLTLAFYINGELIGSSSTANATNFINEPSDKLAFGYYSNNAIKDGGSVANIDNILVYNRALTSTEVKALTVPEPATATLSLLALAGLAARRRRK